MKDSRTIVNAIIKEIEKRVYATYSFEDTVKRFREQQKQVAETIAEDFSKGIPEKHLKQIRDMLGNDLLEQLDPGKIGSLVRKGKGKLLRIYQKLALLVDLYKHYENQAQKEAYEIECLNKIKQELIDSQIAHIHEAELLEARIEEFQMLISIVLAPFENAVKEVISFLKAKQLEVFLFDDDKLLATELKTDGQSFIYNKEDERPAMPETVSEVTLQEVQETTLQVPLIVGKEQIGHYRVIRQLTDDFDKEEWKKDVERITPVLARIIQANRNKIQSEKVYIDDLTQLFNKRKLNEQMGKLFNQFKQGKKQLHIVMIDIDKFKTLNDTYGHPVGDQVLKKTAELIKDELPYAYRYGGEEFLGVFYGFDKSRTIGIVEHLRKRIEETPYSIGEQEYRITISAGIAEFNTEMNSIMDAIDHADQAMYVSKEDGRNRITYFDDVKDRLHADAAKLRVELLRLKEQMKRFSEIEHENIQLAKELAAEKNKDPS